MQPHLDQWLFVGGRNIDLGQPQPNHDSIMFKLQYLVNFDGTVEEFGLTSNANFNFNFLNDFYAGGIKVLTEISVVDGMLISSGSLETDDVGFPFLHGSTFMPVATDEFYVTTYAMAFQGASFTSLFHEFSTVPEPTSVVLLGLAGIAMVWRRR